MKQLDYDSSIDVAQAFLTRCFDPGETIALMLRGEKAAGVQQRIVLLERALAPRYLRWLAHENSTGANIYVAANPLRTGSRKRNKESIANVRHLYLDIDNDGEARLAELRASDALPKPTAVLSTSPGRYQVFWRVQGFDCEGQENTLKLLALGFGGDPACTDCNRVLRVPGFRNTKYDPAHLVTIEYCNVNTYTPGDFQLHIPMRSAMSSERPFTPREHARKRTNSEQDWAWVLSELACGKDQAKLTRELASRRSDKRTPLYYAQRTVDVASAHLWLVRGVRLDDVITMLKARRRVETPSASGSARAQEIALTAQRMIARTRSARSK
jgi:hypothetical protein